MDKYIQVNIFMHMCIYIYKIIIHSTHTYIIMQTQTFILDAINHVLSSASTNLIKRDIPQLELCKLVMVLFG